MGRPGIMLTTDKANPSNEGALNCRDDLGHAIRVRVMDVCLLYDSQRRSTYRGWWQSVFRTFHNQRLSGVPESIVNRVELHETTPVSSDRPQMVIDLTVRSITREIRGFGT